MELEELKKSGEALDKQLQKKTVTDEKQLTELINTYQANARKSLKHIHGIQRTSVIAGILILLVLMIAAFAIPTEIENKQTQVKAITFVAFLFATCLVGLWWDIKTFRWCKSIQVETMPVVEVSRRVAVFRKWTKYEIIAISIWAILFNVLYYWLMSFYTAPATLQALLIMCFLLCDMLIIYFLYKKFIYKQLNNINKNIDELKDICTE